jgi:glycosyl transferase family 2
VSAVSVDPATHPLLSVVIVIVSDTMAARAQVRDLAGCLEALAAQIDGPPMELIVPCHARTDGIDALATSFPAVRFIVVDDPEVVMRVAGSRDHHDTLRARGLAAARGEVLALLEDHARPDPHWAARIAAAHRGDDAAIGGAIENGVDRPLNWAIYFCDFSKYQNPLPAGASDFASDANIAYKRSALESVRSLWERSFREVVVNAALTSAGRKLALDPGIVVYQHRGELSLAEALRERFVWGRSYAATRSTLLSGPRRLVYAVLSPILPLVMIERMALLAWQRRRRFGKFVRSLPLIVLLVCGWSAGECAGYLGTHRGGR